MAVKINIGDSWKTVSAIKINIGDTWKTVSGGWINIGDTWKQFMSPLLTWPGSTHTEAEVVAAGGTVYDTGSGTIGRFTQSTPPAGWTQAAYWQKYNTAGGTDSCSRFGGNAPTTFSNQTCNVKRPGSLFQITGAFDNCANNTTYWHWNNSFDSKTYEFNVENANDPSSYPENTGGYNPTFTTITRQEIGCY